MAVLHRALFTWFLVLLFLILLVLRLDERTKWNWFIVFIPMWLLDCVLLIYVVFNVVTQCKNTPLDGRCASCTAGLLDRKTLYVGAVFLKIAWQIVLCTKLEQLLDIPVYCVLIPVWIMLPPVLIDVTRTLTKYHRN